MENVTVVIRVDVGLINVNPETVEEALNKYFTPDGAVSVFYAVPESAQVTGLCACKIFIPSAFSTALVCRSCGKPPRRP
jgi:hypothetical protein